MTGDPSTTVSTVASRSAAGVPATTSTTGRSGDWLLNQLPVALRDSGFFARFVSIFQHVGSELLEGIDNIENLPDLSVSPAPAVRWLGSWIGVESIDPSLPEKLQRSIVRGAANTLTRRGTAGGLKDFLELVSGGPAEVEEGGGVWRDGEAPERTAWVKLTVRSTGWLPEAEFVELVKDEIPAHVSAELWVGARLAWDSEGGLS
jgi:phage tail-like protein